MRRLVGEVQKHRMLVFVLIQVLTGALVPIVLARTLSTQAQEHEDPGTIFALEEQTLEEVFPHRILAELPFGFILSLRFLPAWHEPESQIVISGKQEDGYTVTLYRVPTGSASAWDQISSIKSKSESRSPTEIAKQVKIVIENVNVPPSLISRQLDRLTRIQVSPIEELNLDFAVMDAPVYYFYLRRVANPTTFSALYGGERYGKSRKKHQLVVWMKEMRSLVDDYAPKLP